MMNSIRHHTARLLLWVAHLSNRAATRLISDAAIGGHMPSQAMVQHPSVPPPVRGECLARMMLAADQDPPPPNVEIYVTVDPEVVTAKRFEEIMRPEFPKDIQ